MSSCPKLLKMNLCISGRNEWFSHRHPAMHSYILQLSAHDFELKSVGKNLVVDDLCQLKHSRVLVLSYNSLETPPITLLKNCARTAVMSCRERKDYGF
ncbi:hypothetical protein TNCV_799761 [Trichonephila clavipes]|nr:hypothetical protein TNCV_799761 [Trichonephila clavipes]